MGMLKCLRKPLAIAITGAMLAGGLTGIEPVKVLANENVLAFDSAEGGGKYATGGRGYDTYVVTSLEDYGKEDTPIEGTLRYGIEQVAATNGGAVIVFNVGGVINLKTDLKFKDIKNVTLAGQTAPGDGITIAGYQTDISNSENLIIRYLRFRPGAVNVNNGSDSMDALWGRDNSLFIIDHCSFSWNTDETLSTYRGQDGTVQYCMIYESLTVSGHTKGRHGYGGIFGGDNVLFQYNLIANTTSRAPRMGGGSMGDPTKEKAGEAYQYCATTQVSNNVIYNYGFNVVHGGGWQYTNYMNNYMINGQGSRENISQIIANAGENNKPGGFYVSGNVLYDGSVKNEQLSADNRGDGVKSGVINTAPDWTTIADKQYTKTVGGTSFMETKDCDFPLEADMESAEESYIKVLNQAGATYPKRDAQDARVVEEVKNDTGRFINTEREVGGYTMTTAAREAGYDTDMDGMPDTYEDKYGFNKNDKSDAKKIAENGRSNVENYFNGIVDSQKVADNPTVKLDVKNNSQYTVGETITIKAEASANNGGSIEKVEFYNGTELVGTDKAAPYECELKGLADGTYYISARAYDNNGTSTQATAAQIHVNSKAGTGSFISEDIGTPGVAGSASLENGVLTVKGAGKLGKAEGAVTGDAADASTDSFHYVYQKLNGDGTIIAKLSDVTAIDNHAFSGIMIRENTDRNAKTAAVGMSLVKQNTKLNEGNPELMDTTWAVYFANRGAVKVLDDAGNELALNEENAISSMGEQLDSKSNALAAGIPLVEDFYFRTVQDNKSVTNGVWLKLVREGNVFTGYAKNTDTEEWRIIGSVEIPMEKEVLVGFAVDANKVANDIDNLSTAKFSDISIEAADTDVKKPETGDKETGKDTEKPETGDKETGKDTEKPETGDKETGKDTEKPETGDKTTGNETNKPDTSDDALIEYKVKKGDCLWKIARKYGTTVKEIVAANTIIKNPDLILIGWVLKVPTSK